jgi:SNF2 family DNA or RNA helicase
MKENDKVYYTSNPQKVGILQNKIVRNNRTRWYVKFSDQVTLIPEEYLALCEKEEELYSLPVLISKNMFNSVESVRREITKIRLNGNLNDMLYSMGTTNTDFYAHQFKPVMKIINSASNSVLIADEVGLGKTIEAGLIWTELKQRFNFKKLLIICPGVLRQKWKDELKKKMGVKAEIVDAKELLRIAQNKEEDEFALICSRQGLVTRAKAERKMKDDSERDKGNLIRQTFEDLAAEGEKLFDLLIVDEAHYLRNPETQIYKIAKPLREVSEYATFLSATPIQNKSNDLLSLVTLLDPTTFQREFMKNSFDEILEINRPLIKLRDGLLSEKIDRSGVLALIEEVHDKDVLGLFENSKQLAAIQKEIEDNVNISQERLHHFAYEIDSINSLGYIINRTRKRDIQENKVQRMPIPEEIKMTSEENIAYELISDTIRDYAELQGNEHLAKFLLCMPQRMMSSCIYASLNLWKQRSNALYYEDSDDEIEDVEVTDFMREIYDAVAPINNLQSLYEHDTKYKRLLKVLKDINKDYPKDKVVLFSSFVSTLEYLQKRLEEDGIKGLVISGKVKNKDAILDLFEKDDSQKILLASEVGSEGVDLQFCRLLINYDLPWNPMRVEQRIGRLDRIGQKHPKILIWNMFHDTTIDKRIYYKLYSKFDICTSALGDFEVILGDMFRKLSIDLLLMTPQEQEDRIEQTRLAIINKEEQNNKLEEEASQLTAYGDYVLQEIQKSKDEDNIITSRDIANYVIDTLRKLYENATITATSVENKYEIALDSKFRVAYEDFCFKNGLSTNSLLLRNFGNITCVFTNNVVTKSKANIEVINQFHPIIRFLRSIDTKNNNTPTAIIKVANSKNKGLFLIGVSLMSAKGVTSYEKLLYGGKNIETGEDLPNDLAKKILLEALNQGRTWADRKNLNYSKLGEMAEDVMMSNLDFYEKTVKDIENQNHDKAEMQKATLQRHLDLKRQQLEETKIKRIINHNENMIKLDEAKFARLEQKIEDRMLKIEKNKDIQPIKTDICMAVICAN